MMQKGHQVVLATPPAEKRIKAEKPEGGKFPVWDRSGFLVKLCATLKEAQELIRELREDRP